MTTPSEFVLHWHAVARIAPPRFIPESWLRQADVLIGKGITLGDLTLVGKWMLTQLARSQAGERNSVAFNAASFGWVKMFGEFGASNQHENFLGRLTLAEAARRPAERPVQPACIAGAAPDEAEQERIRQDIRRKALEFKRRMEGGR
jgi:hypothetical protein